MTCNISPGLHEKFLSELSIVCFTLLGEILGNANEKPLASSKHNATTTVIPQNLKKDQLLATTSKISPYTFITVAFQSKSKGKKSLIQTFKKVLESCHPLREFLLAYFLENIFHNTSIYSFITKFTDCKTPAFR